MLREELIEAGVYVFRGLMIGGYPTTFAMRDALKRHTSTSSTYGMFGSST